MNNSDPKFWNSIKVSQIKDVCYKGLSKPVRAVKQFCPIYFDGIKCWKEAMVEQTVQEPCPDYVIGFDLMKSASKTCGADGVWLEPTNYTSCLTSDEDLRTRNLGHFLYVGSYGLASFIMVLALFISVVIRKGVHWFRVNRVNFFLANLFKNIMSLTWYINVIRDPAVVLLNPVWCQIMHNTTNYSNLASHFWLFGVALHIYLEVVGVQSRMKVSLLLITGIGWTIPLLIEAIYSMTRIFYLENTESCWTGTQPAFYIISTFNCCSLLVSFVLLAKAIYIEEQMTKRFPRHDRMVATMKCAKATLILIPLYAVQDYLISKQQSRLYALNVSYLIVSAVNVMFKVFITATTFCFTDEDDVTSCNNSSGPRQEEPEVEIPMTDMSGNMRRRDSPV